MQPDSTSRARSIQVFLVLSLFFVSSAIPQDSRKGHGLDPSTMDLSVKPCEDFFLYSNGTWVKNTPIPPAFSSWGSFTELAEKNNEVLHQILEEAAKKSDAPKGSNLQKIGDFYATGMDSASIESLGWKPIQTDLNRIAGLKNVADVQAEIAWLHQTDAGGAFSFSSGQDLKNSNEVIGQLGQGGLGMPDRDYYVAEDEKSKKTREDYLSHIEAMFTLIGDKPQDASANAATVMAFESRLAKASRTRVERRDPDKNYNRMTPAQLAALTPDFSWPRFFEGMSVSNIGDVNVGQPEFLKEINAMLKEVPISDWKMYLRWRVVSAAAPALSTPFVQENFRFHGMILTGAKELQPRWKRIMQVINGALGEALGQVYVERTFPPQAKARAREMVGNLVASMRDHITRLEWMDDVTKKAALKKLESFGVKIGNPDEWRDYSGMNVDRITYMGNLRSASAFNTRYNLNKIGKPVNRNEWGMTPPTVNAYYSSTRNEIVFPAGILQPPFFDPEADDAVNYGGMGAVIGHEISHGFDDQGSKFDGDGNLKMWWTPETRKKFEERTNMVVQQFDSYVAIDSLHVNGKLTLGENIGDLGGLSIAYSALQKALEGKPQDKIDGFTPAQRFFLAWAQIWRRSSRPEQLRLQVKTDPHSPAQFRTNGPTSNMQEFYDAFGCGEGSKMVRPVAIRAKIW